MLNHGMVPGGVKPMEASVPPGLHPQEMETQTSNRFDLPVADSMWPWQVDLGGDDSLTGHMGAESEPRTDRLDHFSNDADLDPDQGLAADISAQASIRSRQRTTVCIMVELC